MPFRQRQKLVFNSFCKTSLPDVSVDESGNVLPILKDVHEDLPSPENFRLGVLLKAGVNLEEVNTKLFPAQSVDSSIFKNSKPSEPKPSEPKPSEPKPSEPKPSVTSSTNN